MAEGLPNVATQSAVEILEDGPATTSRHPFTSETQKLIKEINDLTETTISDTKSGPKKDPVYRIFVNSTYGRPASELTELAFLYHQDWRAALDTAHALALENEDLRRIISEQASGHSKRDWGKFEGANT